MDMKVWQRILLIVLALIIVGNFGIRFDGTTSREAGSFYTGVSVIENGEYAVDTVFSDAYETDWSSAADYDYGKSGRAQSLEAPLGVLLSIPIYGLQKLVFSIFKQTPDLSSTTLWFRFWFGLVPGILSLLFLFPMLEERSSKEIRYLTLFIAIASTLLLTLASTATPDMLSVLFIVMALFFFQKRENPFLAGIFSGLLFAANYQSVFIILGALIGILFSGYRRREWGDSGKFLGGLILPVAAVLLYHKFIWGGFFSFPAGTFAVGDGGVAGVLLTFLYSPILLFAFMGKSKEMVLRPALLGALGGILSTALFGSLDLTAGSSLMAVSIPCFAVLLSSSIRDIESESKTTRVLFLAFLIYSTIVQLLVKFGFPYADPDLVQRTYWAGAYYLYGWVIQTLASGEWKYFLTFSLLTLSFIGFTVLYWIKAMHWNTKGIDVAGWVLALGLLAAVLFIPRSIQTETIPAILETSSLMASDGAYLLDSFDGAKVKTEFEENQEWADLILPTIQAYAIALETAQVNAKNIEFYDYMLYEEEFYNEGAESKTYEQIIAFEKIVWSKMNRYLIEFADEKELPEETQEQLDLLTAETLLRIESGITGDERRKAYEFLFYALATDYDSLYDEQWDALYEYIKN